MVAPLAAQWPLTPHSWSLHAHVPWERPRVPAEARDPPGMRSFLPDSWAWGEDRGLRWQLTSPRQFLAWDLISPGRKIPLGGRAGREEGVTGDEEIEVPSLGPFFQNVFKKTLSGRLALVIALWFGAQKQCRSSDEFHLTSQHTQKQGGQAPNPVIFCSYWRTSGHQVFALTLSIP